MKTNRGNKRTFKTIVSVALVALVVAVVVPFAAFATDDAPAACSHVHNEACGFVQGVPCDNTEGHEEHVGCSFVAGNDCTHVHDGACGLCPHGNAVGECSDPACLGYEPCEHGANPEVCVSCAGGGFATMDAPQSTAAITVEATAAPKAFKTFTDLAAGNLPPTEKLTVSLVITLSEAGVVDGRVELPLNYTPAELGLTNFTMNEPFFTLVEPGAPGAGSIVDSFDTSTTPGVMIIHLKDGLEARSETVTLEFVFNTNYDSKVPKDTTMWNMQPTAYVGGTLVHTGAATPVLNEGVTTVITVGHTYTTPSDYTSNNISVYLTWTNNYYYQSDFDPAYDSILYFEIPTGFIANATTIGCFDGVIVDVDSSGYDRYYKVVKNEASYWNYWHDAGVYSAAQRITATITPQGVSVGDEFEFRIGAVYKKINAPVTTVSRSIPYTKVDEKSWALAIVGRHTALEIDGVSSYNVVVDTNDTAAWSIRMEAGRHLYNTGQPLRNEGTGNITGVSFVVWQASTWEEAEKVNFGEIEIRPSREDGSAAWSQYKVDYVIVNALTGQVVRTEACPTVIAPTTGNTRTFTLALPTLGDNEYVDKVIVTPMGTDGVSEGVWPGKNGLGVNYRATTWSGEKWPNGTEMGTYAVVPMKWTLYYDSDPTGPLAGAPTSFEGDTGTIYYASGSAVDAYAKLVSSNPVATAGGTVNYEIQGYNDKDAIGGWADPRMVVRVPKCMELVNAGGVATLTDAASGQTYEVAVQTLPSDDTYNYYVFQASGYTAAKTIGSVVFTIPVQFEIAEGTAAGTYGNMLVAVSTKTASSFIQSVREINPYTTITAAKLGFSGSDVYSANTSGHTTMNVTSNSAVSGLSEVYGVGTGNQWVRAAMVPAENGDTVQMRVTIANTGNTTYKNIKLYNILPANGDSRGSDGQIAFAGLVGASGATVWYTTGTSYPSYTTVDMQDFDTTGWTQGVPTAGSGATAIYIDFGTTTIAPGASVTAVLSFTVPATGDQLAYNQFRYSVVDGGTNVASSFNSDMVGISTKTIMLNFVENRPTAAVDTDLVADLPEAVSGTLGVNDSKVTIPTTAPTLKGFAFAGWGTAADSGVVYAAGADVTFSAAGTTTLYAQWTRNELTIAYDLNKGSGSTTGTHTPAAGSTSALFNDVIADPGDPSRTGYTFVGWYETAVAANAQLSGTEWVFATQKVTDPGSGTKTLYAGWVADSVVVTLNYNFGSAPTLVNHNATFDGSFADPGAPGTTKPGGSFAGWYDSAANANLAGTAGKIAFPMNVTDAGPIVLYAGWTMQNYSITYTNNDDGALTGNATAGSMPTSFTAETATFTIGAPTARPGMKFLGWTGGTVSGNTPVMSPSVAVGTTNNLAFVAHWGTEYTIAYNCPSVASGAAGNKTSYTFADLPMAVTAPTMSGDWVFDGWTATAGGNTIVLTDGNKIPAGTVGNIVLTAKVYREEITASDIAALPHTEVGGMDAAKYILQAAAEARRFTDPADAVGTVIDIDDVDFSAVLAEAGTYSVTFVTENGAEMTIDVTVTETYTVTFVYGNGVANRTESVQKGQLVTNPGTPTRPEYRFNGWMNGSAVWNFNTNVMPAGNLVLTASWTYNTPPVQSEADSSTTSRPASSGASSSSGSSGAESVVPTEEPGSTNGGAASAVPDTSAYSYSDVQSDASTGTITLGPITIPTGQLFAKGTWGVANVILSVIALLLLVMQLMRALSKNYEKKSGYKATAIVNALIGAAVPVLFLLGSNFSGAPTLVDYLSLPLIGLVAMQVVSLVVSGRRTSRVEEDFEY